MNITLRSLFNVWKVQIQSLSKHSFLIVIDEKVQSVASKEEENTMVDKAIGIYINEMIKHTMKVFTLSVALAQRDPSSAYESIQDSLEKVINSILTLLDWFE